MADSREKQQLAKIALRRKPAGAGGTLQTPAAPGTAAGGGSSSAGGATKDIDDAFDRSFEETFGGSPSPGAFPEPGAAALVSEAPPLSRQTMPEIDVEITAPVAERPTGAGSDPGAAAGADDPLDDTKTNLLRSLAANTGVPALDLEKVTFDLGTLDLLPRDVAQRNLLLPVAIREDHLIVALADPSQRRALDELEFVSGCRVAPHVATQSQLRRFIEACYRARAAGDRSYAMPGAAPPGRIEAAVVRAGGSSTGKISAERLGDTGDLTRTPATSMPIDLEGDLGATPVPPPPGPAPSERTRKRILVVDDETDIRQLVVRVLRDRGHEVIEATQGAEALRAVQAQLPDLLVLDAMLPEIHGFDVCRRIKHSPRYQHIPVIMISAIYRGWRFASDLKKSYGVDHFMEKPFKIGELVEKVAQLLDGTQAAPAAARELSAKAQAELVAGSRKYREGDLEGAVVHLLRGIEADPLSHQLHYQLGILYGKQGQIYHAIQELEAALEIEPGDFATLRGLGQLYEHAGFPMKAVEMWERAANASSDEAARSSIKEHLLKLL
jgi:DNA-binding response OmpR family regulator